MALNSTDTPARAEKYAKQAENFQVHSKKMADTASALAKSGVVTDKHTAEQLLRTAKKVRVTVTICVQDPNTRVVWGRRGGTGAIFGHFSP